MENIENNNNAELEFGGKTVEEAVQKAIAHFKVPKSSLKIKVLSEEQRGLFGMGGAKQAKIRVSLAEDSSGSP